MEEFCVVPEGGMVGKPLKLPSFMKADFRAIYDNPAGTRTAIISRGRKNAKTTESACIVLLHLCGPEAKPNSQLNSTAQSREQAAVLFELAAKMVRLNPKLNEHIVIRDTLKQLLCPEMGTGYRALSADAVTAFGLSPALTIHDELGQVRGPRFQLYEALETATSAQEDPLSIVISTQAPNDSDLLSVLIDDAKAGHDPRVVLRLNTAPEDLDPFSVKAIKAANPAFDIFMNKREVLTMAENARRMPSRQAEYENYVLNRRVESNSPFVTRILWKACAAPPLPFDKTTPVFGGLDLSEIADLTACVFIGKINNVWQVHPTFWLPDDGLALKARQDKVPYDLWKKKGHLLTAPGKTVDYQFVALWLRKQFDLFDIRKITFDRWNFKHLKPWLLQAGFTEAMIEKHFAEFGQGTQSMSPALRELEADILNQRLAHGDHPVLAMCAANAVTEGKDSSNRKLSKSRSSGRIDGMTALVMARGAAPLDDKPTPKYQLLFV